MSTNILRSGSVWFIMAMSAAAGLISTASADEPGRGLTADFEQHYLKFIIDHHYSALRMTELAAGTDLQRQAAISPTEGTSPTPNTNSTQAKAQSDEIKSMARRNNRMQREEILTAQGFLRDWYGVTYKPHLTAMNQAQIALLEKVQPGASFDHLFMEVLSRHHFMALGPSSQCQVASEITHDQLHRYCSGIVHSQINDIQDMREMLCKQFSVCDYQPLVGLKGRHSGSEGSRYLDAPSSEE
jgi:uncharacterized protein (DUF305 family)